MNRPLVSINHSYQKQVQGRYAPATDWRNFIELYRSGYFNTDALGLSLGEHYRDQAASWVTCAVGTQCAILPRHLQSGRPKDEKLANLGDEFYDAVDKLLRFKKAKARLRKVERLLDAIEARSAFLIDLELAKTAVTVAEMD